eukprot:NODE_5825_length_1731_cov_3.416459.p1 GENE.NODE_5825_length_1731_cov_3.416459~~NODE_5825_length_1731_cov_3.416459.p1  ORF type:complete len:444 (-),score=81.33 NODE_5825_length_1731_cov_3.416459:212-1543(-)
MVVRELHAVTFSDAEPPDLEANLPSTVSDRSPRSTKPTRPAGNSSIGSLMEAAALGIHDSPIPSPSVSSIHRPSMSMSMSMGNFTVARRNGNNICKIWQHLQKPLLPLHVLQHAERDFKLVLGIEGMIPIERVVNHASFQILAFILSVIYCASSMLYERALHDDPVTAKRLQTILIWVAGTPPLFFSFFEVVVHVVAQAGHLWCPSSWRRYAAPLFHKLELGILLFLFLCTIFSVVVPNAVEEVPPILHLLDEAAVVTLVSYRVLRTWAIFYGVSVQMTEFHRWCRQNHDTWWMVDQACMLEENRQRPAVRLQRFLDQWRVQFAISLYTVAHILLIVAHVFVAPARKLYIYVQFVGYMSLYIMSIELFGRCIAQGGERFFKPLMHRCELIFFLGAVTSIVHDNVWWGPHQLWCCHTRSGAETHRWSQRTAVPIRLTRAALRRV